MQSYWFISLIYVIVLTVLAHIQPLLYPILDPIPGLLVHIVVNRAVNILNSFYRGYVLFN